MTNPAAKKQRHIGNDEFVIRSHYRSPTFREVLLTHRIYDDVAGEVHILASRPHTMFLSATATDGAAIIFNHDETIEVKRGFVGSIRSALEVRRAEKRLIKIVRQKMKDAVQLK
jgi:hypothetical protein